MNKHATHENGPKRLVYYPRLYRMCAALIGACCVVLNRLKIDIMVVLTNPGFYLSVALSFVIGLILIETSHWYTRLLDRRVSWDAQFRKRSILHLLVGPIFTSAMAIALAYALITAMGRDFVKSNYLSREYPMIVVMLFAVHFTYRERSLKYHTDQLNAQVEWLQSKAERLLQQERRAESAAGSITVNFQDKRITLPFAKVAYFKKDGDTVLIFMMNGRKYVTRQTLRDLMGKLDGYWFLQTHVSYIVHRAAIKPCERNGGNGVLLIEMQSGNEQHWVRVSRDRKPAYRNWLAQKNIVA